MSADAPADPAIRPMTEGDLEEVLAIERDSFPTPWSRRSFLFELRENPFARNLVVVREGSIVAFACVWLVDDEVRINNIAVRRDRRETGLGRTLLRRVLDDGAAAGCRRATLEVRISNAAARALYRAFGFREIGRRKAYYQDTHEDAVVMSVDLRAGPPS